MDQPPSLDSTFGALFISVVVAAVLYGVSCVQVFHYFQHYSKKDGLGIKAIVIATMICETVHQAFITHTIYTYLIVYYAQPQNIATLTWSPVAAAIPTIIVALLVQIFYVTRIWRFSQRNVAITAIPSVLIAGQFVSSIIYFAKAINMTTLAELAKTDPFSITSDALAATSDVTITIVFCALLHGARVQLQRSNTMINHLIAFSVQTGMLTSLCAVAILISFVVSPRTSIYIAFYFLLGRLYCNSLLATLNVRSAILERGSNDIGISLPSIGDLNLSTVGNHKETDTGGAIAGVGTHGYITGIGAHGGSGSLSFVTPMTHTSSSQTV